MYSLLLVEIYSEQMLRILKDIGEKKVALVYLWKAVDFPMHFV